VTFHDELLGVLPHGLPNREIVALKAARHLEMIEEANRHFNLTRITSPREAAVKHVLDSVLPWAHFSRARHVLDAGTGAGFPGVPLALVLPHVKFTLTDSVGKKARFTAGAVTALDLPNVEVRSARAEELARTIHPQIITGRAVAPLSRACALFALALKSGSCLILYKGPDAESEIQEAAPELRKHKLLARLIDRYDLPDSLGARTLVEISVI
jgi:16S rRNA (guanine527-N7)-methyltransferase